MAGILKYLRGRDTTTISITAQDVSSAGLLTDTSSATGSLVGGRCDSVRVTCRNNTEMIMGVDDIIENHVSIYIGYTIELTEILTQKVGTGGLGATTNYEPILPKLFYTTPSGNSTYEYFKIVVTKGGKTYTLYGLKQDISDGVTSGGKQTATMSLVPVNVNYDGSGTASIAYS